MLSNLVQQIMEKEELLTLMENSLQSVISGMACGNQEVDAMAAPVVTSRSQKAGSNPRSKSFNLKALQSTILQQMFIMNVDTSTMMVLAVGDVQLLYMWGLPTTTMIGALIMTIKVMPMSKATQITTQFRMKILGEA